MIIEPSVHFFTSYQNKVIGTLCIGSYLEHGVLPGEHLDLVLPLGRRQALQPRGAHRVQKLLTRMDPQIGYFSVYQEVVFAVGAGQETSWASSA